MSILIKIHKSLRVVVAVCDSDLMNKRFEEDIRQLEIKENFFKGQECTIEEAKYIMKNQLNEDATYNIVGEKSVNAAIESGVINQEMISKIQNVPFAIKLI